MIIDNIKFTNFRNYQKGEFEFAHKVIIIGDNGVGKTNILEAIYMLASGKSFRADKDHELVRYGEEFANIQGSILNTQLRIFIDGRKRFEVNGVARRMMDFVGNLRAVKFGPEDMEIITGSPSGRRRYLDFVICQKDREYRRSLLSYEKGLRQRNKLLDFIRDGSATRQQLWFWDKLLIKDGSYITETRGKYLECLDLNNQEFKTFYDKSVISETRLKQYENEEIAAGSTLVGPHRDDFVLEYMSGPLKEYKDVSKFGSRGQQRMGVLWLKKGEMKYLTDPVLLLDDVFSELDHAHREEVLKMANNYINNGGQVIMTTADKHLVPKGKDWIIIKVC